MKKSIENIKELSELIELFHSDSADEWMNQCELSESELTTRSHLKKDFSLSGLKSGEQRITFDFFANNGVNRKSGLTLGDIHQILEDKNLGIFRIKPALVSKL